VRHQALVAGLMAGDRTRAADGPHLTQEFLQATLLFIEKYARVEKMVLGATRVAYSQAALGMNLSTAGDVLQQGERLAEAERARFGVGAGPILELGWLIEDQGVKIIPRRFPAGTAARGGFFFDSELGPCILVDAEAPPIPRDYAIAHQYGHFLADYDPYITTICGHPNPASLDDPRELRAHQFALAFMMPRRDLETYRTALALSEKPLTAEFVHQLRVYFAVDTELVFWRLLSLGWMEPPRIETLLRQNEELLVPVEADRMDADERLAMLGGIPERLVHLVASAFGRELIELDDAASYLETDVEEAKHVLEQFRFEAPGEASSGKARASARMARTVGSPPRPSPN
jgi:Zn-dependent peptidase ImmA (M78 family)